MGLDQQVNIIDVQEKLEEFYLYRYGDPNNTTLFDNADEPEELYLHNQYAVQGFMMELALSKGAPSEDELNGAYIRVMEEDIKKLYKIANDLDALKAYAEKWRKGASKYYGDFEQEQVQGFCRELMKYIAFDECAAYYEADW